MVSIRKGVLCALGALVTLIAPILAWHALVGSPVPLWVQMLHGFCTGGLWQYAYYRWTRAQRWTS